MLILGDLSMPPPGKFWKTGTLRLNLGAFQDFTIATTVDEERFTGQYVHISNPYEAFTETLLHFLGQKCLLFSIIKERHLYSWENFCGTLENRENVNI